MSNENYLTVGLTRSFGEDVCTCCLAASFERRSRCRALGTIIRLDLAFQGWIGYAGTHVPMLVHKLGLIKPRQT